MRKLKLKSSPFLLSGLLFDSVGNRMSPSHTVKKGVRYRYYVSQGLLQSRDPKMVGEPSRVSAPDLEEVVTRALHERNAVKNGVAEALRKQIEKIMVRHDTLEIHWLSMTEPASSGIEAAQIQLLAWRPKTRRVEQGIVHSPGQVSCQPGQSNLTLLSAIANSRRWVDQLAKGTSISEIVRRAGIGEKQARTLLNLAFLSPAYVQSLMTGAQEGPTITALASKVPLEWPNT